MLTGIFWDFTVSHWYSTVLIVILCQIGSHKRLRISSVFYYLKLSILYMLHKGRVAEWHILWCDFTKKCGWLFGYSSQQKVLTKGLCALSATSADKREQIHKLFGENLSPIALFRQQGKTTGNTSRRVWRHLLNSIALWRGAWNGRPATGSLQVMRWRLLR